MLVDRTFSPLIQPYNYASCNAQDWGYQKIQEKENGAFKKDYANANMDPKSVVLTTVWAAGVVYFFGDLLLKLTRGEIMADSFHRTMELLGVE